MIKKKIGILFPPEKTDQPFMTSLIKDHDIVVNILKASITEGKKGKMILDLSGKDENVTEALKYLEDSHLEVFVYTDSVIRYEDKCVECGACVGVCPSKALTMEQPEYLLEFDVEKCVLCGYCIKACPVRAISFFDDEI
jgi:L-aspartate semialdehyde sulfurtransferase ferredoxin